MRFSLMILLATILLACSPKQGEAEAATEPDAATINTPEEQPVATSTSNIETLTVSQDPTVEKATNELAATSTSKAANTPSTAGNDKPNVELSATPNATTERAKGPVVTEAPKTTSTAGENKAPIIVEETMEVHEEQSEPDHSTWDNLLRNFVSSSGQVNYGGIKSSRASFDSYISELAEYPPQSDWSRNQIMAYWINAYNAYTIKLIVDNHPVSSIKDIHGGNPWDVKWIKIGGSTYSLNQIENEILRARYGDARIHFAVNCAAASCPPIHNRAFTADNLNSTLQRLTRKFINNSSYNTISAERIEISKIFDWYSGDFGDVKSYINGFTEEELGPETTVGYKEYDWSLNGR